MDAEAVHKIITGASHSGFYADDLDKTIDFYTKVLGAKLEWRKDGEKNSLIKLYIGDFGLSIIKRPPNVPKTELPHAIHFAYLAEPHDAEAVIKHVKSCGVEVEGPLGHGNEPENVSWFFVDPDDYRLEIEARYPTAQEAAEVVARGKAERNAHMGLYGGDTVKKGNGILEGAGG
ncbi:MAG TPA: VOC family protein [Stellaceae bacterium]|nr:VOC family protein [Stellaceae bacterium]